MIIGLSGYARSGKDTAAAALVAIGFTRVAFADVLRQFLYKLNPIVEGYYSAELHRPPRVADVIDKYGWDSYKQTSHGKEIRELLQRLGTECGRELIGDSVWIDAALGDSHLGYNVVVTDVRFENEAEAIRDRDGIVVRIERPGVGPANAHPSETALDDWPFDYIVGNTSTVDVLHQKMRRLAEMFT